MYEVRRVYRNRDLKDTLAHIFASGKAGDGNDWTKQQARAGLTGMLGMWKRKGCTKSEGKQLSVYFSRWVTHLQASLAPWVSIIQP